VLICAGLVPIFHLKLQEAFAIHYIILRNLDLEGGWSKRWVVDCGDYAVDLMSCAM